MNLNDDKLSLQVKIVDDIFRAMEMTDEIAKGMGFFQYDILFLQLVTEEACMNAYEYCQNTNQQGFLIGWDKSNEDFLTIFVKHRGKKYNIIPFNGAIRGLRGRGLQLIVNLMDHVHVEERGENVELVMRKYKT